MSTPMKARKRRTQTLAEKGQLAALEESMISFLKPEEQYQHKNGGGWVAKTATVEETAYIGDDAWVYDGAWVSGNALIYDGARISGYARISGNARIYGDARVYGNALISGNARVCGGAWKTSPLYIQGSQHAITNCDFGQLSIGCITHSFSEWKKLYKSIGKENGYTPAQIKEYGQLIALATKMGKKAKRGK